MTRPLLVDCIGNTALHLACIAGLPEVAEALVQKGANVSASVSASSNCGYSALQVKHVNELWIHCCTGDECLSVIPITSVFNLAKY